MPTYAFALAWAIKKINFWGAILGGFRRSGPKKFWETKLRLQLNNFTQKLDFNVLWFRWRTENSAQDLERTRKKLIEAKCGLVGIKRYLKTYNNPVKYFLPYLNCFWIRPLFTPNFWSGFRVLKPKSCDSLPRNLAQT